MSEKLRAQSQPASDAARKTPHFVPSPRHRPSRAPEWAEFLPDPPGLPPSELPVHDEPDDTWGVRWARGLVLSMLLGLLGAVFYISLFILVGVEIYPSAIVIGILTGAGIRAGGAKAGWSSAAAAVLLAAGFLWVGSVVGRACVESIQETADPRVLLSQAVADPAATTAGLFAEPWIASVTVVLVVCGAIVATNEYVARRTQRL
ncbi:hypothetical protein ON058_03865 [Demequina sp. B12]|uniref:hypothetical protein n=1 Tax=Demequina sp. B12 TaxID=2992757 RepID=UPI00237B12CC|nr:hypothetical protein [Demequina sp. B12]MDE0572547.1 hypothetical protein [Demequina sp. B12]